MSLRFEMKRRNRWPLQVLVVLLAAWSLFDAQGGGSQIRYPLYWVAPTTIGGFEVSSDIREIVRDDSGEVASQTIQLTVIRQAALATGPQPKRLHLALSVAGKTLFAAAVAGDQADQPVIFPIRIQASTLPKDVVAADISVASLTMVLVDDNGKVVDSQVRAAAFASYSGHSISKRQPRSDIARFVDSDDVNVSRLASEVFRRLGDNRDDGAVLREVVAAVRGLGLSYFVDPISVPNQEKLHEANIAAPSETLFLGGGDCEDLSILTASVLARVGIPTDIVDFGTHVAVGVKVRLKPGDSFMSYAAPAPVGFALETGTYYLVLETTLIPLRRPRLDLIFEEGKSLFADRAKLVGVYPARPGGSARQDVIHGPLYDVPLDRAHRRGYPTPDPGGIFAVEVWGLAQAYSPH
ncbi:MAG: hypothetical protein HY897_21150 [Deltaproteobacteria bacterium]|nr:hypothetical protein [Deltaproteobacteria bacterium]